MDEEKLYLACFMDEFKPIGKTGWDQVVSLYNQNFWSYPWIKTRSYEVLQEHGRGNSTH
jgi:hypothetical protein